MPGPKWKWKMRIVLWIWNWNKRETCYHPSRWRGIAGRKWEGVRKRKRDGERELREKIVKEQEKDRTTHTNRPWDRWRWDYGRMNRKVEWRALLLLLQLTANRGNICRKMADVSSLIFTIFIIKIGLVSEIHHSSIKYTEPAQPQIPNWKYPNEYCIQCTIFFSSSFLSRRRRHRHWKLFVPVLFRLHTVDISGSSCSSYRFRRCVWILFISSTHKIHSLFIPISCSVLCAIVDIATQTICFLGVFRRFFAVALTTLLNGVSTANEITKPK